jgi:hypothetical protein
VRARLEEHLGSRQVARVVYGSIVGLALVVALEHHPPAPRGIVASLVGTGVAVGLAEVYSEVVGVEASTRRRIDRHQLRHFAADSGAMFVGAAFPALFFVLAGLGVLEVETAFSLAKWSGLGLIGFYGYWAARFAGAPPERALVRALLVALVGAALILLKSLLH